MTSKRNKPLSILEASNARKRHQTINQENPAKRQQLFARLSTETSYMNESVEPERMVEQNYTLRNNNNSGMFCFNKNDKIGTKLLEQLKSIPQTPAPVKHNTDLKIVKDSDTQRKYFASIIDYLRATKYEGIEPLNIRTLTTGQFQSMFKHLIKRIMPTHIPKIKFEDEVLDVIRELNYPLVNMISPSSLRSIGALHTNPAFFALLYWLTEYCKSVDMATSKIGETSKYVIESDTLFQTYATDCFIAYVNGTDDFGLQNKKLNYYCENILKEKQTELDHLNTSIQAINIESESLDREKNLLQQERVRRDEMNRDLKKYEENITMGKIKVTRDVTINQRLKEEIDRLSQINKSLDEDIALIIQNITSQNKTVESIDELCTEHTDLENKIHQITEKYTDTEKGNIYLEKKIINIREVLENSIKEYNGNCLEDMVELEYNKDATNLKEMLNIDIENEILPQLLLKQTRVINEGNRLVEDTREERRKASTVDEKSQELDKEINGLKNLLQRKKNLIKQMREAEQKRQDEFNLTRENNEKRRFQLQEKSTQSLRKTQKLLEDRKIKVIEFEQQTQESLSTVEAKLDQFSTRISEGVKNMKLTQEQHEKDLISKAEKSLAKFNK